MHDKAMSKFETRDIITALNAAGTGYAAYFFYYKCKDMEERLISMEKSLQELKVDSEERRKKVGVCETSIKAVNDLRKKEGANTERKVVILANELAKKKLIGQDVMLAVSPAARPVVSPSGTSAFVNDALAAFPG